MRPFTLFRRVDRAQIRIKTPHCLSEYASIHPSGALFFAEPFDVLLHSIQMID